MGASGGHRYQIISGFFSREISCHSSANSVYRYNGTGFWRNSRPIQGFWQSSACTATSPCLKDTGQNPYIVHLNRKQYVVVQGESSTDTSVVSGAPQRSVLGPLLFLSYISSISKLPLSNGAQMTFYADDLLLIKPIKDANNYISLQQDITMWGSVALRPKRSSEIILFLESRGRLPNARAALQATFIQNRGEWWARWLMLHDMQ